VSEHILSSDEAAAIALEKYGPGWVAQDGPDTTSTANFWGWYSCEPVESTHGDWWREASDDPCYAENIGPGHPNPEWRETKRRIERKRDA
jgi:hypothetical protein